MHFVWSKRVKTGSMCVLSSIFLAFIANHCMHKWINIKHNLYIAFISKINCRPKKFRSFNMMVIVSELDILWQYMCTILFITTSCCIYYIHWQYYLQKFQLKPVTFAISSKRGSGPKFVKTTNVECEHFHLPNMKCTAFCESNIDSIVF